jgi:hypothetical protein
VPYWIDVLAPELRSGRLPLVVAHGNALRTLVAYWDHLSEDDVMALNIPTGIPLRYDFDLDLRPLPPQHVSVSANNAKTGASSAADSARRSTGTPGRAGPPDRVCRSAGIGTGSRASSASSELTRLAGTPHLPSARSSSRSSVVVTTTQVQGPRSDDQAEGHQPRPVWTEV